MMDRVHCRCGWETYLGMDCALCGASADELIDLTAAMTDSVPGC